ncbi:MAG: hypothetical protein KC416_10535, partial [Myxococcales bacterium]|nr:hypothetical protein [Myxococcales bacterium]
MDFNSMKNRSLSLLAPAWPVVAGLLLVLSACNEGGDPVDQRQTNLVDKAIFEGDWWYARTNIDVDGDEAWIQGVFQGAMSAVDFGVDRGQSISMARIRWVIDEDFLYAYRSYELIVGGNDDADDPDFLGQPLAAFPIEAHVDVRRDYNGTTGEESNVTVENSTDQRWYERQYMRVDWSTNVIAGFYLSYSEGGGTTVPLQVQEGGLDQVPDSWRPQFVRVRDERRKPATDPSRYRWVDEWPADADPTVHYMSFVTQEVFSPGNSCLVYNIPCQSVSYTIRNAFLRTPPQHDYAVETQTHQEF